MKAFDHDKPANKAEWVFAFMAEYRKLRPEIGERYAKTHALAAHTALSDLKPRVAAKRWVERSQE
jgi:hypothetical protein